MKILLMTNITNPRYASVHGYLHYLGHEVYVTQDHRNDTAKYDLGISWYYRVMVRNFDQFKHGVINFHPGILPYVKGAFTNVWPLIHPSLPCGVSAQIMDAGLDTGPIIAEKECPRFPTDTGETLWHRLVETQYELFTEIWPMIEDTIKRGEKIPSHSQVGECDPWKMSEVEEYDNISEVSGIGDYVVNVLRARTFGGKYPSAYIIRDGKKYYVEVNIRPA